MNLYLPSHFVKKDCLPIDINECKKNWNLLRFFGFTFKRKLEYYNVKYRDFNRYFSENKKCELFILLGGKTEHIASVC